MTTQREIADEPFFREWKQRAADARRSLYRAQRLINTVPELVHINIPILVVVGSKGKATAAIYAAATLAAAGLRTGSISSPPIVSNRERIRINGRAISEADYTEVSRQLSELLTRLGLEEADNGYLSPSGLFIIMGVSYLLRNQCDVIVIEAGMGGKSDEVSLFPPEVVAITSIFEEHLGILGRNREEIAAEKTGVVTRETKAVITLPQTPSVAAIIESHLGDDVFKLAISDSNDAKDVPLQLLPQGLSRANAKLGIVAARYLLRARNLASPNVTKFETVMASMYLPGRLSIHEDNKNRTWIVDAAINRTGVSAALDWCVYHNKQPSTILVSIPEGKDSVGVQQALEGRSFIAVALNTEHLHFNGNMWQDSLVPFEAIESHIQGDCILAIGTWSFVGAVLGKLDVAFETAFTV